LASRRSTVNRFLASSIADLDGWHTVSRSAFAAVRVTNIVPTSPNRSSSVIASSGTPSSKANRKRSRTQFGRLAVADAAVLPDLDSGRIDLSGRALPENTNPDDYGPSLLYRRRVDGHAVAERATLGY
jgi:hypothetical protein